MRLFRTHLFIAVALGAACACAPRPAAVEQASVLEECKPDDGPIDALCGRISVFEDRERAEGRTIDLKVVVYRALHREPQPDPLFVLVGGPGGGAAEMSSMLMSMLRAVQEDRDIVFVDQRGTGDSNGLPCTPDTDDLESLGREDLALEELEKCLESYDADLRLYTTPIAMDDLDEVRTKLGYGQINLWGGSYGTRAASVYLRRHGETVRSVVLDGVAPVTMKLPLDFPQDGQRAMDLMFDACEQEEPCRERFPDVRRKLADLLDRLEKQPARVRLKHPRTGESGNVVIRSDFVGAVLRGALYSPVTASMLPMLIEQAHGGDFQGMLALTAMGEPLADLMSQGMFFSVVCAEDLPWIDEQESQQRAAETFQGESLIETWGKVCASWPRGTVADDYHEPIRSDVPALVLSGELDPVTPPRWGEAIAQGLPNSRHIVVPGVGHGTSALGCVPSLIADFIRDGTAADLDAECVEKLHRPPFFVTNAGPVAVEPVGGEPTGAESNSPEPDSPESNRVKKE